MSNTPNNAEFERKRAEAKRYEIALAKWFQTKWGAYILPTYDYSGLQDNKAPKLIAEHNALVIPDLLITRKGKTTWVECKWKSAAAFHRNTQTETTGISSRHFEHYKKVAEVSGCPVMILFLHVEENEMRGDRIDLLPPIHHTYEGSKMGYGGMTFWDYKKLRLWCALSDVLLIEDTA